jgi:hypothetical protein
MSLTKTPLDMLDPGPDASTNDELVFNGSTVEAQPPSSGSSADKFVNNASFDPETGILSLNMDDNSVINVNGFMTVGNIGVGPSGATGPSGIGGQKGKNGKDGRQGLPGCTGPKGDPGPLGAAGPIGPTGPRGLSGATGPQGPSGGSGANGVDGERPVYTPGTDGSSETITTGRIVQWGRFTDAISGQIKTLIYPESFTSATRPKSMLMQWVNPASNVANKVRIDNMELGSATLSVIPSLLEEEPDGNGGTQPVVMSGWDFYWFLIGE